jgi:hypothetical protein
MMVLPVIYNCQGFIDAVDELLQVRTETVELRDSIVSLDQEMRNSGENLVKQVRTMVYTS